VLRRGALCALLGLCLAAAFAASAPADETPKGWAYELPRELMSPFCPGLTLADCSSSQAATVRAWILVQEAAGRSREEVEAELLARYGDAILARPRARGMGLAAWGVPIAAFLAGGAFVALYLRRQTRDAHVAAHTARTLSPELERLVDEELRR
jgi:cytochrome c-type biogenesis protein CcmH